MKIKLFTRYASFVLAIGFFISCTGSKFSANKLIEEGSYEQALTEISAELEKKPTSSLYFQKGRVHGLISEEEPVGQRRTDYLDMVVAFDSAKVLSSENDSSTLKMIDSLTSYYWDKEQKNGLLSYEADNNSQLELAINHFQNAISINPNKIEAYKSLSIAFYNNDQIDQAISTLQEAESIGSSDLEIYESLGFLYLEIGNPELSVANYEKANQNPLKNKNIAFGLVNAYISQDMTTQAISFLEKLTLEYPNESKLHNVYGTQLYIQVSALFDEFKSSYANNDTSSVNNFRVEIEGVSEKSENQLIEAYKMDDSNIEYIESLAVFYNNMSGNYFSVHSVAFDSHKQSIKDKALSLTDFAITYYKQLADSSNQNEAYTEKIENLTSLKESWTNQ